jgi:hypothetical protein
VVLDLIAFESERNFNAAAQKIAKLIGNKVKSALLADFSPTQNCASCVALAQSKCGWRSLYGAVWKINLKSLKARLFTARFDSGCLG